MDYGSLESGGGGGKAPGVLVVLAALGGVGGIMAVVAYVKPPAPTCTPGNTEACPCGTVLGIKTCAADGRSWSVCECPTVSLEPPAQAIRTVAPSTNTTPPPGPSPPDFTDVTVPSPGGDLRDRHWLQIGASPTTEELIRWARRLEQKEQRPQIFECTGSDCGSATYRIVLGPYHTEEQARQVKQWWDAAGDATKKTDGLVTLGTNLHRQVYP